MKLERVAGHEGLFRSMLRRVQEATESWNAPLQLEKPSREVKRVAAAVIHKRYWFRLN